MISDGVCLSPSDLLHLVMIISGCGPSVLQFKLTYSGYHSQLPVKARRVGYRPGEKNRGRGFFCWHPPNSHIWSTMVTSGLISVTINIQGMGSRGSVHILCVIIQQSSFKSWKKSESKGGVWGLQLLDWRGCYWGVGQDSVNGLWMEAGLLCWSQYKGSRTEKWRLDVQTEGRMETHTRKEWGTRVQFLQGFPEV